MYAESDVLIPTFGVMVTAVTSSDLDDETAYLVVKSVFNNLDNMKRLHRALGNLLPGRMDHGRLVRAIASGRDPLLSRKRDDVNTGVTPLLAVKERPGPFREKILGGDDGRGEKRHFTGRR